MQLELWREVVIQKSVMQHYSEDTKVVRSERKWNKTNNFKFLTFNKAALVEDFYIYKVKTKLLYRDK